VLQGFGMGFMFVPMSSMAFATLDARYRADAVGLYSLGRNIGSSVGISILMGALAVYVRQNREQLVVHVNPFSAALRQFAHTGQIDPATPHGLQIVDLIVQREAAMLGYLDDFRLMTLVALVAIPLVFTLRPQLPRAEPAR
jgi:DHA2 family multidrug resistance protein